MDGEPDYRDWIGSREDATDLVSEPSVAGMIATLDRPDPSPQPGEPLPPLWHWMYFAPRQPQSSLGPDGHPARGGFMPPVALPGRMFAGGRHRFIAPLRVGEPIRREGEVIDVARKTGRTGALVFVTVRYRIFNEAGLAIEEEQDIVYRGAPPPGEKGPAPEPADLAGMDWRKTITPDPVLLFRYSALTFNGHRIHYDQPYATRVEGYPGLVVHGPLIATLLMELCRDRTGGRPARSFSFRAKRPIFDIAPFTVAGRLPSEGGCDLVAVDPEGAVAMTAEVAFDDDIGAA